MHVRQRRGNRARLHEDDEDGGGQPAEHERIVVNPRGGAPDEFLTKYSGWLGVGG
jgi:hypothetical protein